MPANAPRGLSALRARLNKRLGEQIFLTAQRDLIEGGPRKASLALLLARALAVLVLVTPLLVLGAGMLLIWATWFTWLSAIIGTLLILAGFWLLPRTPEWEGRFRGRDRLPASFACLDAIAQRLGADGVDRLSLPPDFNAMYLERWTPRGRVTGLSLGLMLWTRATPQERLGLLAHELAHQVNGDVARTRLVGTALQVLARWYDLLSPPVYIDEHGNETYGYGEEFLGAMFMLGLRTPFWALSLLLYRLILLETQRAEYLADAKAAGIAGSDAAASLLRQTAYTPILDRAWIALYPMNTSGAPTLFTRLAQSIDDAPEEERARHLTKMEQEKWAVNEVHPPTTFRIAFLELMGARPQEADDLMKLLAAMDAELSLEATKIAEDVLADMIDAR